jgi:hypothetical protein
MTPKYEYRLQVPLTLMLSVQADSEKEAKEKLKWLLHGSELNCGVEVPDNQLNEGACLDARLYANEPFKGIVVVDRTEIAARQGDAP